jgi:hypothetical protein
VSFITHINKKDKKENFFHKKPAAVFSQIWTAKFPNNDKGNTGDNRIIKLSQLACVV